MQYACLLFEPILPLNTDPAEVFLEPQPTADGALEELALELYAWLRVPAAANALTVPTSDLDELGGAGILSPLTSPARSANVFLFGAGSGTAREDALVIAAAKPAVHRGACMSRVHS